MPPKKRKFESTFPAARIKKIMQLDDDVGRVASSVPAVVSSDKTARAVEIFLNSLLTRADDYAASRNARTLSVSHLKHCIEGEKQWDFLKELTAKIPDISAEVEEPEEPSRKGRKRMASPGIRSKAPAGKRKQKAKVVQERREEEGEGEGEESESDSGGSEPSSARLFPPISTSKGNKASNLVTTTSRSAPGLPGKDVSGVLGQYQKQSGGGGGLSITDLVAAGTSLSNTRHSNSDDDYD